MNAWLDWGIPVIVWLQNLGDWLISPMKVFTFLGTEEFYLVVMPAILWCFDVGLGFRLGLLLVTSDSLNGALKPAFGWPRPYWVTDRVRALSTETSFGLPSGHAQNAVVLWGRLAAWIRRRWAYIVFGLLILLISVSRVHLAVHYPSDILAGWLVGGVLLLAFMALDRPICQRLGRLSPGGQILVALVASLVLLGIGLVVFRLTEARLVPEEWARRAASAAPGSEPIDPRNLEGIFASTGMVFGMGAGGALLFSWGRFNAGGAWWKRAVRYLVGLAGVVALWLGLRALSPQGASALAFGIRYMRYAVVGFWAAYLAPRLFVWLRLA